ncbi:MAG: hypothetical protein AAF747_02025 [Planctomycetota bacterium]
MPPKHPPSEQQPTPVDTSRALADLDARLFDRPAQATLGGPALVLRAISDIASPDGYRLSIAPDAITIGHRSFRGLLHARHFLQQLGNSAQCIEIEDSPAIPVRGVMLDFQPGCIPTMAHLHEIVPMLSAMGFNHLQLRTSHTFAYRPHAESWRGLRALTHDEVRRLDTLCRAHGLDLVASQQCLSNLRGFLQHEPLRELAETDTKTEAGDSLCPTDDRAIEFVASLLRELLPCFTTPMVNVGCALPTDFGTGRSASAVAKRGPSRVYWSFVKRVMRHVRDEGVQPMLDAGMALEHRDGLSQIPQDATPIAWGAARSPWVKWCEALQGRGRAMWLGCDASAENVAAVAQAASEHKCEGVLIAVDPASLWPDVVRDLADAGKVLWNAGRAMLDSSARRDATGQQPAAVALPLAARFRLGDPR